MSTWVWLVIAAMVVLAALVLLAALVTGRRRRTKRLKERFGPEYERTVSAAGDPGAAERELTERERRRDELDIVALPASAMREYTNRWHGVQSAFVDDPSNALGEADRLLTEVMRQRGYPVDDFDRRAADLSVDHPTVVENYRAAHDVQLSRDGGGDRTEEQRQAFVHYRALFDKLLDSESDNQEASA